MTWTLLWDVNRMEWLTQCAQEAHGKKGNLLLKAFENNAKAIIQIIFIEQNKIKPSQKHTEKKTKKKHFSFAKLTHDHPPKKPQIQKLEGTHIRWLNQPKKLFVFIFIHRCLFLEQFVFHVNVNSHLLQFICDIKRR